VVQAGPTKLTLYYDGNEIKRLDSHTVVFRNTGNRPLKALPVTIECTNGGTVLERELSVPDGAKFETTSDQNSIFVNIDLLNPGETFSVGFSVADAASPGGIKVVARAEFLKLRNIGVQVDTAELLDELMRGMPFGRLIAIMVRAL
jgi:hypothetical protein